MALRWFYNPQGKTGNKRGPIIHASISYVGALWRTNKKMKRLARSTRYQENTHSSSISSNEDIGNVIKCCRRWRRERLCTTGGNTEGHFHTAGLSGGAQARRLCKSHDPESPRVLTSAIRVMKFHVAVRSNRADLHTARDRSWRQDEWKRKKIYSFILNYHSYKWKAHVYHKATIF